MIRGHQHDRWCPFFFHVYGWLIKLSSKIQKNIKRFQIDSKGQDNS